MKIIKGLPTMKAMNEIIDKHGLIAGQLDWKYRPGKILYRERATASECAERICEELRGFGFAVEHRRPRPDKGLLGCIDIRPKT